MMDVKDFCKAMAAELDRGAWGDIDPYLFHEIAANRAERFGGDDLSPDADALMRVLENVLGQNVAHGRVPEPARRGPGRRGARRIA
jgi:hypothetical protein